MPSQEEVNRIIEQAKKNKGIDMSWLKPTQSPTQAQVQATGGIERISPGASQLMDAVRQAQAQTPVYMPFPGGTPTQQRRQAEEASRQFDIGQEFSREQFDWEKDLTERQFAADQAYKNAQLTLSRLGASGGGSSTETGYDTPWGAIDTLIAAGASMDDIMEYVNHPANFVSYKKYGVGVDDVRDYARNKYEKLWQHVPSVSAPPPGASYADFARGLRQAEEASRRIEQVGAWDREGKFTEADYQRFAEETNRPVEEIRRMDEMGWLEDFMKKFYGQQYKWEEPTGTELEELIRQIQG